MFLALILETYAIGEQVMLFLGVIFSTSYFLLYPPHYSL